MSNSITYFIFKINAFASVYLFEGQSLVLNYFVSSAFVLVTIGRRNGFGWVLFHFLLV